MVIVVEPVQHLDTLLLVVALEAVTQMVEVETAALAVAVTLEEMVSHHQLDTAVLMVVMDLMVKFQHIVVLTNITTVVLDVHPMVNVRKMVKHVLTQELSVKLAVKYMLVEEQEAIMNTVV